MTEELVVDTNVAVVANGGHDGADDACLSRCVAELGRIQLDCRLWLDDDWLILREYLKYLDPRGLAGPGDAFIKWVLNNQGNEAHIGRIAITPDTEREFVEFPDDPELASFDRDDRKFVAVALASGTSPPIVNASDRDWWEHREALQVHGIEILFLCPELMQLR